MYFKRNLLVPRKCLLALFPFCWILLKRKIKNKGEENFKINTERKVFVHSKRFVNIKQSIPWNKYMFISKQRFV